MAEATAGFTIVEVLIAVLTIGIVLAAAFSSVAFGYRNVQQARDFSRVAQLLQSQMEDLRLYNYNDLESRITTSLTGSDILEFDFASGRKFKRVPDSELDDGFGAAYGDRYRVYRGIWARSVSSGSQLEAMVVVQWENELGATQTRLTSAWISKGGINDFYYRTF